MENPKGWNEVEQTIAEAIKEHEAAAKEGLIGISLMRRIYCRLRDEGMIHPEHEEHTSND